MTAVASRPRSAGGRIRAELSRRQAISATKETHILRSTSGLLRRCIFEHRRPGCHDNEARTLRIRVRASNDGTLQVDYGVERDTGIDRFITEQRVSAAASRGEDENAELDRKRVGHCTLNEHLATLPGDREQPRSPVAGSRPPWACWGERQAR